MAGLHSRSFWLLREAQECSLLRSSHGMLMLLVWGHHTWSTTLATWPSLCPSNAQSCFHPQVLAFAVPSIWSWPWRPPFMPFSGRPCSNTQVNVVFPFPGPQCHIPRFRFLLRLLSLSEITFVWLSQGWLWLIRDTNTPGQRTHVSLI